MTRFLMSRHDFETNPAYRNDPSVVPIDCPKCGSPKCGTFPPWHPRRPSVWECLECRCQFSVHRDPDYPTPQEK
jgi:hypothetical protein